MNHHRIRFLPGLLLFAACFAQACGGGGGGGGGGSEEPDDEFRILDTTPIANAISVPVDVELVVRFSEPLIQGTIDENNFLLAERANGKAVLGTVTVNGQRTEARFRPGTALLPNNGYLFRVLPDVTGVSGRGLPDEYRSTFNTALSTEPPPPPPPPPVGKGVFDTLTPLQVGRSSHTATRLTDGRVLVAGGFATASALTDTAEVYLPAARSFVRTSGNLNQARAFHASAPLPNGEILVSGGVTGANLQETAMVEIYSPSLDRFWIPTNQMLTARAFHTATTLNDGMVLIAGGTAPGSGGSFSTQAAELYDHGASPMPAFASLTGMTVFRAGHTATKLPDGRVVILGGNSTDRRIEIYNPTLRTFDLQDGTLMAPRRGHTATLLPTGEILITGGGNRTAEVYNVNGDYCVWVGSALYDRRDHTADLLGNGLVLLVGGQTGSVNDPQNPLLFHRTTEAYSPSSRLFIGGMPMLSFPAARHCSTMLKDGTLLITGGMNPDGTAAASRQAALYVPD